MPFQSEPIKKKIEQIQVRYHRQMPGPNRVPYSAREYEQDVEDLVESLFPFSRISGLRLFSAKNRLKNEFGLEMDNIVHLRVKETDYVIIIESKKQKVNVTNHSCPKQHFGELNGKPRKGENGSDEKHTSLQGGFPSCVTLPASSVSC